MGVWLSLFLWCNWRMMAVNLVWVGHVAEFVRLVSFIVAKLVVFNWFSGGGL